MTPLAEMAALELALPISKDEYLRTSYHPDCDFVDGIVLERPSGQFDHANLQTLLAAIVVNNRRAWTKRKRQTTIKIGLPFF